MQEEIRKERIILKSNYKGVGVTFKYNLMPGSKIAIKKYIHVVCSLAR